MEAANFLRNARFGATFSASEDSAPDYLCNFRRIIEFQVDAVMASCRACLDAAFASWISPRYDVSIIFVDLPTLLLHI